MFYFYGAQTHILVSSFLTCSSKAYENITPYV